MSVQITTDEFRKLENRFIFWGGSEFGNSIADTIDELRAENAAQAERIKELEANPGYWRKCHDIAEATNRNLRKEIYELEQQLAAANSVVQAAENLVAQKGRHNTEIAYKRLAETIAKYKGDCKC